MLIVEPRPRAASRGRGQYQVQGRAGQHKQQLLMLLQYFAKGKSADIGSGQYKSTAKNIKRMGLTKWHPVSCGRVNKLQFCSLLVKQCQCHERKYWNPIKCCRAGAGNYLDIKARERIWTTFSIEIELVHRQPIKVSETYEGDVSCFWVEFYPNGVQGRGGQQQLDKLELEEYFGNRSKRQHSDPAVACALLGNARKIG